MPAEEIIESPSQRTTSRTRHNKWLVLIAAYKFVQALLIASIGCRRHAPAPQRHRRRARPSWPTLCASIPSPASSTLSLDKASLLNDPLLRRIGAVAFSYAGLSLAEGIGLYLEKAWGEFLTLAITASFLPWEVFEVFRRLTWVRVALLIVNTLVFIYLLKVVAIRRKHREEPAVRLDSLFVLL